MPDTSQVSILTIHCRAVQAEFLSSVNWKQLLAVNMGRQQQAEPVAELWDACERGEGEAVRRRVAYLLDEAGLDDIPWYRKEAIYNDIAQAAATNGLQSFDIQDIVRLASTREDNVANRENKKRKLRLRAAQAWTNIPLSICEEKVWKGWPASDGIREELQQASRQVKAVSVSRASFGEAGRLFNLEKLSVLLEYALPSYYYLTVLTIAKACTVMTQRKRKPQYLCKQFRHYTPSCFDKYGN